jgi:signal transduction histidine kinase/ActR/RegA family two-component response regulator
LSFVVAGLGFLYFLRIVKQVNALVQDFIKVEQGEIEELGERDTTSEFTEMARIADAFNKTLADLKAHTKELTSLVEKITTLSELTDLVSRIPNIKEILKIVLQRTMGTVNARIGSIMLLDDKSQTLRIATAEGLDDSIVAETIIRLGEGIAGKVAESGELMLVEDMEQDSRFQKSNDPKYGSPSFICMPLRAQWRVMGVLSLAKKRGEKVFSESEVKFLTSLLGHIGFALENAKLLKEAKEATEKLHQVVGEQSHQLDEAQQQALRSMKLFHQAQKMEAIGTLAGGIAHDFNNLLMAIQGRISIMLMNKDSSHPDFGHLRGVEGHVESAADLTKQLLGFARGGKYEVKPTNLNELIEKQNRMFGRTKKEITIHGTYEENLWSVDVDRGQIEQALLNLYVNAWQAMAGGGNLYLETENATLDENYVKPFSIEPGRYVKISVTDTGVGMDKATQESIFDPFFTTKQMGRGTGLGLASVYGIIKNHGGFINVYSEKGHGTTFNIYLPASEKEVIEEKKSTEDILRGSETVLFVDDEDMIIEIAEELFEQLGYKVLTARSGREAIETYEKNKERIDIVILDMVMPDMSGGETYDRMKDIDPKVKVLLFSGYSIDGQATEILNRGCNRFIQKPFKMKELSQKLREVLDEK